MFRLIILLVGIAWASLLLISWGAPPDATATAAPTAPVSREAS